MCQCAVNKLCAPADVANLTPLPNLLGKSQDLMEKKVNHSSRRDVD
jgi:hypothetical protein